MEGKKTNLVFDDYKSDTFDVKEGIDQGDAHLLISWIIYNHQILKLFDKSHKETAFLFIDDTAIPATGPDFDNTHARLKDLMGRKGGVMEWAKTHNCSFGIEKFQLLDLTKWKIKDPTRP